MDPLMKANHLNNVVKRVNFDTESKSHVESLNVFIKTGRWGDIQFNVESPCITVVETVMRKFIQHHILNVLSQMPHK